MIRIENVEVAGWQAAIRGMRSPLNSWDKSDSSLWESSNRFEVGTNDLDLMKRLAANGAVHAKYRRMITVTCDIVAPLYWWKEFDTYKVGTVANSCSTMHKIHAKRFTIYDFSYEHLESYYLESLQGTIRMLNEAREMYLFAKEAKKPLVPPKDYWWQMIQLLPSSYNQRRTVLMNYEVLANIYRWRKDHKLDEWRELCKWIESLPYAEVITGEREAGEPCRTEESGEEKS